jgi:transposase InsO family protein
MTFVAAHRDRFGVEPILRVLDIAVSTFYGWLAQQRDPCQHRRQDAWLAGKIRAVHKGSGGTYGAPRVHAQLRRDGVRTSRKRVARLMATHGLQGAFLRKRWRCSTRQDPTATPAPDLVGRDFTVPAPNRLWVADISRIPTGEGPLWLAAVRDAFSRRIVGWKTSDRADTELVLGALEYAVWGRGLDETLPSVGSSTIRIGAPSTPPSASPSGLPTRGSSPPWAGSATRSITPWRRTSSPP